mgnify:CR=1 FL=1
MIFRVRVTKDGDSFALIVVAASAMDAVRQVMRWYAPRAKSLTVEV